MRAVIDFRKKEIHFSEDVSIDEMASCMNNYFPEDIWGDFKFVIDERANKRPDIESGYGLSHWDGDGDPY